MIYTIPEIRKRYQYLMEKDKDDQPRPVPECSDTSCDFSTIRPKSNKIQSIPTGIIPFMKAFDKIFKDEIESQQSRKENP